jgi:hypothetical protein
LAICAIARPNGFVMSNRSTMAPGSMPIWPRSTIVGTASSSSSR